MVSVSEKLIKSLEKFFHPFPHLPDKFKEIFLPIIPWYLFIKGLGTTISGLRSLSASFQLGALPKIFSRFFEINSVFLFWHGLIFLLIGFLYFAAFTNLAQKKTHYQGWINWLQATFIMSLVKIYIIILNQESIWQAVFTTVVGWFLIFEFQKFYKTKKTKKNSA